MLDPAAPAQGRRVLFDESTARRGRSGRRRRRAMRPEHPAAASYAAAAAALAERDFEVARSTGRPLDDSRARRRRRARHRAPVRRPRGSARSARLAAVLAPTRSPPSRPSSPAAAASSCSARRRRTSTAPTSTSCWRRSACGSRTRPCSTTGPPAACRPGCRREAGAEAAAPSVLHLVDDVALLPRRRAGAPDAGGAACCARAPRRSPPGAGLLAAVPYGDGRVVVAADSDLFGDDFLGRHDHRQLWLNLVYWVGAAGVSRGPDAASSPRRRRTRRGCGCATRPTRCACCRSPNGEVDLASARRRRGARRTSRR